MFVHLKNHTKPLNPLSNLYVYEHVKHFRMINSYVQRHSAVKAKKDSFRKYFHFLKEEYL